MNNTTITLFVSKDFENRKAIRKVSDNLTVANCYLSRKNEDGTYTNSYLPVHITSKTECEELKEGSLITVNGFLAPKSYVNKDGKTVSYTVLVAKEIQTNEKSSEGTDFFESLDSFEEEFPFE